VLQLNKEDVEFMWNELVIYLHFILIVAFLFVGIYAWKFNHTLSFIIFGADILFVLSVIVSISRKRNYTEMKTPYVTKEFTCEMEEYFNNNSEKDKIKATCATIEKAYRKGFRDGHRK